MASESYWDILAGWMLEILEGNPAEQERVLHGDPASIRAALKCTGKLGIFENMGDREFMTVVHTAQVAVGRVARAWRVAS